MRLNFIRYLFVFIVPLIVFLSLYFGDYWSFSAIIFVFAIIPLAELFLSGNKKNMGKNEEEEAKKNKLYDLVLYSLVPVQFFLLMYFLVRIGDQSLSFFEKAGMVTAFGISCGVLGINAAHELGHRNTRHEQYMSKILLLTTQYMHFFIEHNRGHHKKVATADDPATSRYGENLYSFYIRSVRDSWLSAWNIEKERLKKKKFKICSLKNEMLWYQIIQGAFLIIITVIFGFESLFFYLIASIIGFLLLETVNYIEHYGLQRKKINGVYERTLPVHSWNSNHPIGRILLLELSRHSDHHFMASRKYQILRHFDDSPQMPAGYPGMMLISFFPPLWFRIMHRKINKLNNQIKN
jgi:alkane 1-monooxygenase